MIAYRSTTGSWFWTDPDPWAAYPVRVYAPNKRNITSIAWSHNHAAFLAGGKLYVMGWDAHDQLGLNSTVTSDSSP